MACPITYPINKSWGVLLIKLSLTKQAIFIEWGSYLASQNLSWAQVKDPKLVSKITLKLDQQRKFN